MFLRNIPVQITKGPNLQGVGVGGHRHPKGNWDSEEEETEGGRSGLAQWAKGQEGRGGTSHSIFGENTERTRQVGPASGLAARRPLPVSTGSGCTPGWAQQVEVCLR